MGIWAIPAGEAILALLDGAGRVATAAGLAQWAMKPFEKGPDTDEGLMAVAAADIIQADEEVRQQSVGKIQNAVKAHQKTSDTVYPVEAIRQRIIEDIVKRHLVPGPNSEKAATGMRALLSKIVQLNVGDIISARGAVDDLQQKATIAALHEGEDFNRGAMLFSGQENEILKQRESLNDLINKPYNNIGYSFHPILQARTTTWIDGTFIMADPKGNYLGEVTGQYALDGNDVSLYYTKADFPSYVNKPSLPGSASGIWGKPLHDPAQNLYFMTPHAFYEYMLNHPNNLNPIRPKVSLPLPPAPATKPLPPVPTSSRPVPSNDPWGLNPPQPANQGRTPEKPLPVIKPSKRHFSH